MNARELYVLSQWLEPLMQKKRNPAIVGHLDVSIEDPNGLDHLFRIENTGDVREPWQLSGLILNGAGVPKGEECFCHFGSCSHMVRALRELRKGTVTVSSVPDFAELIFIEPGGIA